MKKVEAELAGASPDKDTLLTIGVFDGVHLGHKYLISRLVEQAGNQNLLPGVVTFRQHPHELLSPQSTLPLLTNLDERTRLLKNEGVKLVVPLSFTDELCALSARRFVSLLQKHLRMRGLVIGPDFALGKDREGNAALLSQLGKEIGFSVSVVPPEKINGEVASSTAIRKALAIGDVKKATRLAGRPFRLGGNVVSGSGRGTGLGFPTANLAAPMPQALPADGVYATWAHLNGTPHPSLTNIGTCPTFGGVERRVEVHIIDYHGDLYGRDLKVDFVDRLRAEKQFGNVEELKKQMADDMKRGKAILAAGGNN
ncbi:MAG: bifunctional riboflavin kinase/FAD synthetase [Dehalococcoidales bacterium]|nr:bifunctional riboflavin kinase/FAD synthetase [Dehalococcoidales bacterium]